VHLLISSLKNILTHLEVQLRRPEGIYEDLHDIVTKKLDTYMHHLWDINRHDTESCNIGQLLACHVTGSYQIMTDNGLGNLGLGLAQCRFTISSL